MGIPHSRIPPKPSRIQVAAPLPVLLPRPGSGSEGAGSSSPSSSSPEGVIRRAGSSDNLQRNSQGDLIVPLHDIEGALPIDIPPPPSESSPSQSRNFLNWKWRSGLRFPGSSSPELMPKFHQYVEEFTIGQPVEVRTPSGTWEMAHIVELRYGSRIAKVEFFSDERQEEIEITPQNIKPGSIPKYYKGREVEIRSEATNVWEPGLVETIHGDSVTVSYSSKEGTQTISSRSPNLRPLVSPLAHMKTHKKPEPKSGSFMKWIVKREPVKSESKKKVNDVVELQSIVKTRQLRLRKAPIRDPTVVTNPARARLVHLVGQNNLRLMYSGWVSQARKKLLVDNFADIWKRHEEVGFIAKCDGSKESKIILRDGKKGSFDMKKVLPLTRWKKEKSLEREAFSDEDSDEEDSEYDEVVIPKKKQQAKRKRGANEAASSKRIKPNPNPQIRIPKKLVPRAMPNKQAPKNRPWASMDVPGPPPGAPPKRFKPNQSKPLSIPFRR